MHVIIEHIVYSAQMYENIFSQRSNWFSGHQGTPGCDGTSRQSRKKSEYKKCPADLVIPIFSELFVVCSTKSTRARHYCSFSKRLGGCSQWVNSVEAVDSIKYKFVIRKCLYSHHWISPERVLSPPLQQLDKEPSISIPGAFLHSCLILS